MPKITHVVGARPNFMKVAPVIEALTQAAESTSTHLQQTLVHTGQHYTPEMSNLFFDELGLPEPDTNLEVGSGPHGQQTGRIMERFEQLILNDPPDAVLVVGDVNSTIACALVAKKLGVKVIHVEAGLRSRDLTMPEEINRMLTDAISDLLFTTEAEAEANLVAEGVDPSRIHFVGNVMIDSLLKHKSAALKRPTLTELGIDRDEEYILTTIHRPSNVDDPTILTEIIHALADAAQTRRVVLPLHPRTAANLQKFGLSDLLESERITVVEPLGYLDFMNCMANAWAVVTDSGGIQEETTILGVPCLTVRENTERPVTISHGTNRLVKPDRLSIGSALSSIARPTNTQCGPQLWDGKAGQRIAKIVLNELS